MEFKCIIFDCDGVLVNSEDISSQVLTEMAQSIEADVGEELFSNKFQGKSLQDLFDYIESKTDRELPVDFEKIYRKRTFKAFRNDLKPIDGIHSLLDKINIDYCVASNGPLEKIKITLTATNLFKYFKGKMFSSYEINRWKPAPDLFLYAAQQMGYKPQECIVIEDSMAGVQAATNGGFKTYGYIGNKENNPFKCFNIIVFQNMHQLTTLLNL